MDGLFNVYKEEGMTSFDVVAQIRKIARTRTVGHSGTLDPNATGVLVVAVGSATKVIEYIENDDKIYNAELTLGIETDTEDIWGEVLKERDLKDYELSSERINAIIKSFIGKQIQVPPMYSALKVNGKKLYELAREGKEIERKGREIEIFDIYNMEINDNKISFTVHCSKGTYIRTLCKDIGEKIGCGATMSKLERTKAGGFSIQNSVKLEDIKTNPEKYIINLESVLEKFPIIELDEKESIKYINGVKFEKKGLKDGMYRVYINKKLYGICAISKEVIKHCKKIFCVDF